MKALILCMLFLCPAALLAADLPDWAEAAVQSVKGLEKPAKGDWIMLDETRISLRGDGRYRQKRRQVRWILDPDQASGLYFINGDEASTKVKKLKGWHRHGKKVDRLDKQDILTFGLSSFSQLNKGTMTAGMFEDVDVDSIVAFESDELIDSKFSRYPLSLFGRGLIHRLVFELDDKDRGSAYLQPIGFEGWKLQVQQSQDRIEIQHLPSLDLGAHVAPFLDAYPYVLVGFSKARSDDPLDSWDAFARWYYRTFRAAAAPKGWKEAGGASDLQTLHAAVKAMQDKLVYRQVYLSADRDYSPLAAEIVERAAAGDCKDLSAYLAVKLNDLAIEVLPVICTVMNGPRLSAAATPQPTFNHAIAAIRLKQSLGLGAEVQVGQNLYLLFDPTVTGVPLGLLPAAHARRQVMICAADKSHWVAVPDKAIFAGGVKVALTGVLERNGTLSGRLVLSEKGDEWGLASAKRSGNMRALLNLARAQVGLPGQADLLLERCELDAANVLELVLQVQWPMFLTKDLGAHCLPQGLFPGAGEKFTSSALRVSPLYRAAAGRYELTLDLNCELKLQPLLAAAEHRDAHGGFNWQVSGGERLQASYAFDQGEVYYDRARLDQGMAWYEGWRQVHNGFLQRGLYFALVR